MTGIARVHRDTGRLVSFSDAVFAAFNAYYWLPIRGERPCPRT